MRLLFVLCFLLPLAVSAQLDKVKPGMSEANFNSVLPEAQRDYEVESYWITKPQSLGKVAGLCRWKSYRDTITEYDFRSEPTYGPSAKYKTYDSTQVHAMKVELEKLRLQFETVFGPANVFQNVSLQNFPADPKEFWCYRAVWIANNGQFVSLGIMRDNVSDEIANAPYYRKDPTKAEVYTLYISITNRNQFFQSKYGVGLSELLFGKMYPELNGELDLMVHPIYSLLDTITCSNAAWIFEFENSELIAMTYWADGGKLFGGTSDSAVFTSFKTKAEILLKEGISNFGTPDSLSNRIPVSYIEHNRNLAFDEVFLYAMWKTDEGSVILEYALIGGGKNPEFLFTLDVEYLEDDE